MLCQMGWATGSNLVAAGASACFLRLLKSSAGSAAGSVVGSRRQPFSTTTAGPHAEAHGARQEPADRAVASAKQHLKVKLPPKTAPGLLAVAVWLLLHKLASTRIVPTTRPRCSLPCAKNQMEGLHANTSGSSKACHAASCHKALAATCMSCRTLPSCRGSWTCLMRRQQLFWAATWV